MTSERRRGGQPGNTNAVKHGFYSKQLKDENLKGLDPSPRTGLTEDIVILKVTIRRLVDIIQHSTNPSEIIEATRALFLGYQSLTRMVKTQHLLSGDRDNIWDSLNEVLESVHAEFKAAE